MPSDGDAPGATRARGGSARPSQAGGAADPAAGSDACGGGAAGRAASDPGAAPPGDSATPLGVGPASQMTSAKAAAPIARPPATMPSVSSQLRDRLPSSVHAPVPGAAGALLASSSRARRQRRPGIAAGGGVEHDPRQSPDATVGPQQAGALEAQDRIRRGRIE